MKWRTVFVVTAGLNLVAAGANAQSVLFDFDSLAAHSGLPGAYTVGGITASFSATGQGFSIQAANTMGFTPLGFAGNCIYPNSVYASDLLIGFSTPLTAFSILYAPQELACDDSARMRVTAYLDGALVGTATAMAANPGTWPSETLAFSSNQPFNRVVVHYDARPSCSDYGPIFMADNMQVTPVPLSITLVNGTKLPGDAVQFDFAYTPGAACSAYASADASLAVGFWNFVAAPTEVAPGQFQFSDPLAGAAPLLFYQVTCP